MPKGKPSHHAEILEYALSHLEKERDAIDARISHIRQQLGSATPAKKRTARASAPAAEAPDDAASEAAAPRKKRALSDAARKRIGIAQKKRWAAHRKSLKAE